MPTFSPEGRACRIVAKTATLYKQEPVRAEGKGQRAKAREKGKGERSQVFLIG
jgi:hypothetical protein